MDNYRNGKVVSHDRAWRAGVKGARFGLMIPAAPVVGQHFYQEIAPKIAMDRVEVVSIDETVQTPAGTFAHCVHLRETTPLERGVSDKILRAGSGHRQGRCVRAGEEQGRVIARSEDPRFFQSSHGLT